MSTFSLVLLLIALRPPFYILGQQRAPSPSPSQSSQPTQQVPVMDGGAGPCSVELTVTDAAGKPVYAATIKVHMAYGFAGIRKLDLEAGTNSDGKVKFTGLPAKVHNPPLEFHASKDQLVGAASYNPATECEAKHDIMMDKAKEATGAEANSFFFL